MKKIFWMMNTTISVRKWYVFGCRELYGQLELFSHCSLYSYQHQDKVTLKLFITIATTGKLEMALDLVDRLHLEKSFDIAMTVADRLNHRNLSDRIDEKKELRFKVDDSLDDGVETGYQAPFNESPADGYVDEDEEMAPRRRITPDSNQSRKAKHADVFDDGETEQWSRPEKKSRHATEAKRSLVKPMNPFAKKRLESPARPSVSPAKSPSKLALSRSSTFSAQSREKSKVSKRLL
jgi:chromosome transmission fidelity protein 4